MASINRYQAEISDLGGHLYLGSSVIFDCGDDQPLISYLRQINVQHLMITADDVLVLNEQLFARHNITITRLEIPDDDLPQRYLSGMLDTAEARYAASSGQMMGTLLVCREGRNRSCAVALDLLVKVRGLSADAAFALLKDKRPQMDVQPHLMGFLLARMQGCAVPAKPPFLGPVSASRLACRRLAPLRLRDWQQHRAALAPRQRTCSASSVTRTSSSTDSLTLCV